MDAASSAGNMAEGTHRRCGAVSHSSSSFSFPWLAASFRSRFVFLFKLKLVKIHSAFGNAGRLRGMSGGSPLLAWMVVALLQLTLTVGLDCGEGTHIDPDAQVCVTDTDSLRVSIAFFFFPFFSFRFGFSVESFDWVSCLPSLLALFQLTPHQKG